MSALAGCTAPDATGDGGTTPTLPGGQGQTVPDPPDNDVPLSQRPHVHDYWEGATSLTLLDENVQVMLWHNHLFDEPPREQHTHGCDEKLASDSQGGSRKFSLPEGVIVLPGAEKLSFLIDWTTPSITGLRLLYRPANQHALVDAGLVTNGQPIDIPLTIAMTDAGHATQTSWVFFLCADGSSPANSAEGSVHVNLLALRGAELPLEPAHPDHWGTTSAIELANLTNATTAVTAANKGDGAWVYVPVEHGVIVPPETSEIVAHVELHDSAATAGTLPVVPILYYRDSTVPEWQYKTANATEGEFRIPVDHNMVDGTYAKETNWDFWIRLSSPSPTATPAGTMSQPRVFEGTVTAHIFAVREPPTA